MEEKTVSLPVPLPIYGTISVTSQPNGATVYVDGEEMGTTPLLKGDILIGHHKVEFRKQDYQALIMDVDVKEGELTSFSAEMTDVFLVSINSEPSGAGLTINDVFKGFTPYSETISSGDYYLSLEKAGYSPYKKRIHLDASNPTISIKLGHKYLSQNNAYFGSNYQMGHITGAEVINIGGYLSNCNIEAGYFFPTNTTTTFWNDENMTIVLKGAYSIDLGYGLLMGNHIRITPRLGMMYYIMEDDKSNSQKIMNSYVISGRGSVRLEYVPFPKIGLICTPAYEIANNMGKYAKLVDAESNISKDWCSGFSLNVGFEIIF